MTKPNVILVMKFNHILKFEGNYIFSDDLVWTTKTRQNLFLKKLNDKSVSSLPHRDGFNPFGEIIYGSEYPFVLS